MLTSTVFKQIGGFGAATLLAATAAASDAFFVPLSEITSYDKSQFSQQVTECDVLAGHPDDPMGVTDGVTREQMDKPAAIKACQLAVKADPDNPRLNYQLARAYGYSNLHAKATPYREKALKSGYPQSLFVMGYIRTTGWDGQPADACYGGELIRRSAQTGRYAGNVYYPRYALQGLLNECADDQKPNWEEVAGMLDKAKTDAEGVYQDMLADVLKEQFERQRGE